MRVKTLGLVLMMGIASVSQAQDKIKIDYSDFEIGEPGKQPSESIAQWENATGRAVIDNTQVHSGKQSLLIDMTSQSGYLHLCANAKLKPGTYVLSVWAKADPKQTFLMQIYDARKWGTNKPAVLQLDGKGIISKEVEANNTEWRKYEIELNITEEFPASIQIGLTKQGKLWLDDLEITTATGLKSPAAATSISKAPGGAAIVSGDVKIKEDANSLTATNNKIRIELKKSESITISGINQKSTDGVSITLLDKSGKQKIKPERWSLFKKTPAESIISVYAGKPEKAIIELTMRKDSEYVIVYPGRDTDRALLEMKSQISVLPDMLGEDYLYFPEKIKNECRVPTESYCILNLMNDGNTMSACMWNTDDTKVHLGKNSPDSKNIDYNVIETGKLKKFYVGIISAPGVWHEVKEKLNNENFTKVDWQPPFSAQWLMTMRLNTGLMPLNDDTFDTWVVPVRTKDGSTVRFRLGVGMMNKEAWNVWGSLHNTFVYPLYLENNVLFARYPKCGQLSFKPDYPPVIYAYKYGIQNAYDEGSAPQANKTMLPYDMLAAVLPYQEILHLTSVISKEDAYPATCAVTAEMLRYFKDDQTIEKREIILRQIDLMNKFVDVKDKRFNDFRIWASREIEILKRKSSENAKLKPLADELIEYLKVVEKNYTDAKEAVKTPDESATLSERYVELMDDKNLSAEQKELEVDKLGREIRTRGGARDNLMAKMRLTVKSIRSHLTEKLTGKLTPDEEQLIANLRKDCGDVLWMKHGHEGK